MAIDRGEIDAQLREIGEGERWWEQREFRDLPHILHPDERVRGLIHGRLVGRRGPRLRPTGRWLLVATTERLICLRQERFARKQIEIVPGQVTRVVQKTRLRSHQITIETPHRRYRIRVPKGDALRFTAALAPLLPRPSSPRLRPELEAFSWIPGVTTVASLPGFTGLVSMLSAPEPEQPNRIARLEATVERLEAHTERLQQQVGFLEDLLERRAEEALLERRHEGALLPGSGEES